jgi:hypothetical protein
MVMAKVTYETVKPNVAGALQSVRAKKSREQIKVERFRPFVHVIDAALAANWSWSAIVKLIREHGGPSLTKIEAEALYAQLKDQYAPNNDSEVGKGVPADESANASQAGVTKQAAAQ